MSKFPVFCCVVRRAGLNVHFPEKDLRIGCVNLKGLYLFSLLHGFTILSKFALRICLWLCFYFVDSFNNLRILFVCLWD